MDRFTDNDNNHSNNHSFYDGFVGEKYTVEEACLAF